MARAPAVEAPLQPRYRRPLTVGGVLDETVQVYRVAWRPMVGLSLLWVLPFVLGLFVYGRAWSDVLLAPATRVAPRPEVLFDAVVPLLGAAVGLALASLLLVAAGSAAASAMTEDVMRARRLSVARSYRVALTRLPAYVGATVLYLLATALLAVVAIVPFVLTLFGTLGTLLALLGLVAWAASPAARRPWLKWLIVITTPFGLALYISMRWALYGQAVVLERLGPLASLRRSADLVGGYWFRVFGVLVVVSVVTVLLQSVPGAIASVVVLALGYPTGRATAEQASLAVDVANNAANLVGTALFGALSFIAATILFVDLRNRHDGADLAERIALLEASLSEPAAAG